MALLNRVALVTGSTSGIGLGIARRLAAQKANVVLNGFGDEAAIQNLVSEIKETYGVQAIYNNANLMDHNEIEGMIKDIEKDFGGVDILCNNAGIQHVHPIETFPVNHWDAILSLNLSSVFHTTRLCLPYMRERKFGRIINIASAHGHVASKNKSAYVAAKHGVIGFTKATALETSNTNITANAICPGWVLTPLVEQQIHKRVEENNSSYEEEKLDLLSEKQPHCEFTTPEQLGDVAVFLCSDGASNIRGSSINVEGGWLSQ